MSKLKRHRNREKLAQKMLTRQNANAPRPITNAVVQGVAERRMAQIRMNQLVQTAMLRQQQGHESPIPIDKLLWNPDYIRHDPMKVLIDSIQNKDGKYQAIVMALHPEQGMVEIYRHSREWPDRLGAVLELARVLPLVGVMGDRIEWPYYDEHKGRVLALARERRQRKIQKRIGNVTNDEALTLSERESNGSAATVDPVRERTEHQRVRGETSQAEVSDNG
jgi:hypothetical protein